MPHNNLVTSTSFHLDYPHVFPTNSQGPNWQRPHIGADRNLPTSFRFPGECGDSVSIVSVSNGSSFLLADQVAPGWTCFVTTLRMYGTYLVLLRLKSGHWCHHIAFGTNPASTCHDFEKSGSILPRQSPVIRINVGIENRVKKLPHTGLP